MRRTLLASVVLTPLWWAFAEGPSDTVHDATGYDAILTAISHRRDELSRQYDSADDSSERSAVLLKAGGALTRAVCSQIAPEWMGTPWDFYGTTQQPGRGKIACGYFVTTVLRDAGVRLRRCDSSVGLLTRLNRRCRTAAAAKLRSRTGSGSGCRRACSATSDRRTANDLLVAGTIAGCAATEKNRYRRYAIERPKESQQTLSHCPPSLPYDDLKPLSQPDTERTVPTEKENA